ncbi:MAG: sulfatase-like hydrolase/transferase [Pseudomonadota bacterium]
MTSRHRLRNGTTRLLLSVFSALLFSLQLSAASALAVVQGIEQGSADTVQEDTPALPAKPNFVVILIDDAAFMDLGVYGGEARTPNIDALARTGALFTNYRTSPLCSPSG